MASPTEPYGRDWTIFCQRTPPKRWMVTRMIVRRRCNEIALPPRAPNSNKGNTVVCIWSYRINIPVYILYRKSYIYVAIASPSGIALTSTVGSVSLTGTGNVTLTGNNLTSSTGSLNALIWETVDTGTTATWREVDTAA